MARKILSSPMNSRSTLFVLAIGFSILIALIASIGFGAVQRADTIYREIQNAEDSYSETETFRQRISTDIYLADILLRDYLMDPSSQNASHTRQDLLVIRNSLQERLDLLSKRMTKTDRLVLLRNEVQVYWDSLNPVFEWTAKQTAERSWIFLARSVLPRRQAIVDLVGEIGKINAENLEIERQRLKSRQAVLHRFLLETMSVALIIGSLVALLTIYRVLALERRHAMQRRQIEETQNDLRRLSRRLVQAHEVERKALSRELHDEIGQMMTALGITLRNLETQFTKQLSVHNSDGPAFLKRMEDAKRLNADVIHAVHDLAMGLRPSMLDDFGLEAALQWQGREFSRHTGVPASVKVDGAIDNLTDEQRTCIYRIVQEALTNCARHANARNVIVSVRTVRNGVFVKIQDDGVGFDASDSNRSGLGLLSIQERVQELDGKVRIISEIPKGTTIQVKLPVGAAA
jgi:signal transduction histidine kinase